MYYAILNDVWLISLRRDILMARIDDVLAGRVPKGSNLQRSPSQMALDFAPLLGGWWQRAVRASLDTAAIDAHEHACIGFEGLARGLVNLPADPASRRELALRLVGYEPESPQGGTFSWRDGLCDHPVYGNPIEPRAPDANDPDIPLHALLSGMGSLRFELGLLPRAESFELSARFQLNKEHFPTTKDGTKN